MLLEGKKKQFTKKRFENMKDSWKQQSIYDKIPSRHKIDAEFLNTSWAHKLTESLMASSELKVNEAHCRLTLSGVHQRYKLL